VARGEAVILFVAAGQTFAIAAAAVDEIRSSDGLAATRARGKVHSVLKRGQSSYYVVDVASHFRLPASSSRRVLVLRNAAVALAVDSVDRMAHLAVLYALPHVFCGDERRWYRGLALVDGHVVPVVNPSAFLTKAELAELDAGMPARGAGAARGAASA
jgi:chemotaxis signal transduction protein